MSASTTALTMFALYMATFLAALDMTIVTTALPTITLALHGRSSDYSWLGSSYLLGAAAATPIWGGLSDIFGRKPILLITNIVFFVGSLICGLSVSMGMLIAGRAIQGIGGGGLTVMSQICIGHLFSMRRRALFFGIMNLVWAFACAIGPVLGGLFTSRASWRWCFFINLPCDGVAFIAIVLFVRIESPKTSFGKGLQAIDWMGSIAVVGGTVMLLLGLNFGRVSLPWNSTTVIALVTLGTLLLALFLVIEAWIPRRPIIPVRMVHSVSNIACLGTCFFQSLVFISATYFLPIYFQNVLLVSPLLSGVYLLPFVVTLSFAAAASGVIIRKTGIYRPLIWFGMAVLTLGFGLFIDLKSYTSWSRIIIFQILAGIGTGPNFQAPLIALQNRTRPQDMAAVTGGFLFVRNLATSMSVVFGGAIFDNQLARLVSETPELSAAISQSVGASLTAANGGVMAAMPPSQRSALQGAYTASLRDMWIFYTGAAGLGTVLSLLIKQKALSDEHQPSQQGLDSNEDDSGTKHQETTENNAKEEV
ncbi:MFS drug transporter [Lophiostoma macrostomum CBS 122681]|uniref:Efflux pump dotC n=1 Tax=Lophiostoma macrostomum CBS 122681 TaxID=1314788 RepID=A0A6A6TMQ2_9PLEO|nr:MFS drug transporter [Lophiostoma macrostomum CBS 122681]